MSRTTTTIPLPDGGPQIIVNIDGNPQGNIASAIDELYAAAKKHGPEAPSSFDDGFGSVFPNTRILELPNTIDRNDWFMSDSQLHISEMSKLAMRMQWGTWAVDRMITIGGPPTPFDHVSIHRSKTKVLIFLVKDGQPATLEDDLTLFPSDSLVTRLRMIQDANPE